FRAQLRPALPRARGTHRLRASALSGCAAALARRGGKEHTTRSCPANRRGHAGAAAQPLRRGYRRRGTLIRKGGSPASHTPAPESFAAVASFRTWRSSRTIVAGGPTGPPWTWAQKPGNFYDSHVAQRASRARNCPWSAIVA